MAYITLKTDDDATDNLERAISFLQQALEVRTREAWPLEWAHTMQGLASAYLRLPSGDRAKHIDEVISIYHSVLDLLRNKFMFSER